MSYLLPMLAIEMVRTTARVGINGRAQIPYDIRKKLGISDGDQLVIEIEKIIHVNGSKDIQEATR